MPKNTLYCCLIFYTLALLVGFAETASEPFRIPSEPPETVITANSLHLKEGVVQLIGNVKAIKGNDVLTCGTAFLNKKESWILASLTPRLYEKESVLAKKVIRETTVDARSILWMNERGEFHASSSVVVKVEERSWDLATYSWVIISSDELTGYRQKEEMVFRGGVRVQDKDHFGTGQLLEYFKASDTAILSVDAMIETEEWSKKEKKMVKRILTGQKITYNLKTKSATSE